MSGPHLPLLAARTDELSKCAYCPKLCRATCVVSEVEAREALTPGAKMTNAFEASRGANDSNERAELAWACSNCLRCREACDHKNPVADTLNDARADFVAAGIAPAAVQELLSRAPAIAEAGSTALDALSDEPGVERGAPHALLLGCRYVREFPAESRAAIRMAVRLVGAVELLSGCCGAWQRAAGAKTEAQASREALLDRLGAGRKLLVLDAGCALELRAAAPTPLVALAARHPERFGRSGSGAVRYHDSCALGRGLGLYEEPRRLLARVTGEPPLELTTPRAWSRCSGGGGVLPVTMPAVARGAATRLSAEHERLGGGTLVTGCASSLSQMRRAGTKAVDLITLLEAGMTGDD